MAAVITAVIMVLTVTGCGASIRPMTPRSGGSAPVGTVPLPASATDWEYFEAYPLMVPVLGVKPDHVDDTFNAPRSGGRIHRATDIMAKSGTPVVAASNGTILRLSRNPLGGITIYMLDEAKRFLYYYAHLSGYSDLAKVGREVRQGEVVAYVGSTGNAGVPHLHFQAMRWDPDRRDYWNGAAVDVRPFFTLPGTELASQ